MRPAPLVARTGRVTAVRDAAGGSNIPILRSAPAAMAIPTRFPSAAPTSKILGLRHGRVVITNPIDLVAKATVEFWPPLYLGRHPVAGTPFAALSLIQRQELVRDSYKEG
jgi:hypothetical protein